MVSELELVPTQHASSAGKRGTFDEYETPVEAKECKLLPPPFGSLEKVHSILEIVFE